MVRSNDGDGHFNLDPVKSQYEAQGDSAGPNGFPQIGHHRSGPRDVKPEN